MYTLIMDEFTYFNSIRIPSVKHVICEFQLNSLTVNIHIFYYLIVIKQKYVGDYIPRDNTVSFFLTGSEFCWIYMNYNFPCHLKLFDRRIALPSTREQRINHCC